MNFSKITRMASVALVALILLSAAACALPLGDADTTTVEETTTGRSWPEIPVGSYDPALDDSTVDTSATHTVDATQWVVTDGLDRVVSTNTETGDVREDKTVAMFYWSWHGVAADEETAYNNQQNIDKLIAMGRTERDYVTLGVTDLRTLGIKTAMGPNHFWDEPIYGYYDGDDEWVIRKQAELLAAAGVDVVFFDNTNGTNTWKETAMRIMKVFSEARSEGVDAPDVAFMLPFYNGTWAATQMTELYSEIYSKGLYEDVWFELDGKPMIMSKRSWAPNNEIKNFFTFRAGVPEYTATQSSTNQWGWLSTYPQAYYRNSEGEIEQITVGTAVNHDAKKNVIAPMSGENVIGRTWTSRGYDTRENALLYGACFAEQWEYALYIDPEVVFVTGWNEWIAMRQPTWSPPEATYRNCFADQYNAEYSRDCEPSAGILKDHYYYQLVDNIRKFKGTNAVPRASTPVSIDVGGGFGQWDSVGPTYTDYFGLSDRDALGYKNPATGERYHYVNETGRNDFYDAKVARDYEYVYFMVRTVEDITPYTDAYWMRLYIDTGATDAVWENYEFILNKSNPDSENTATLERFTGDGFATETVGRVAYSVQGNVMTVAIPRAMLGIPEGDADFELGFKWTDNTCENGDIMQWYLNGDTAPIGRYNYCYTTKGSETHVDREDQYGLIDLTSEDMQNEITEYMLGSTDGTGYAFSDEGLTLTATEDGGEFILDFTGNSRQIVLELYDAVSITYKVTDGATDTLRFAIGAGSQPRARSSRASGVTLLPDGEEHTVTVNLADIPKHDLTGCVKEFGLFFAEEGSLGASVTVTSIEFLTLP